MVLKVFAAIIFTVPTNYWHTFYFYRCWCLVFLFCINSSWKHHQHRVYATEEIMRWLSTCSFIQSLNIVLASCLYFLSYLFLFQHIPYFCVPLSWFFSEEETNFVLQESVSFVRIQHLLYFHISFTKNFIADCLIVNYHHHPYFGNIFMELFQLKNVTRNANI